MKKLLVAMFAIMAAWIAVFAAPPQQAVFAAPPQQEVELVGTAVYYKPGQDEDYSQGFGVDGQFRFWLDPNVGLSLSMGGASWEVEETTLGFGYGDWLGYDVKIEGDVTLIPIGGSLLLRPAHGKNASLTLEAGVRYVVVDSQIELQVRAAVPPIYYYRTYSVEIDDGVIGIIGATIEGKIGKDVFLLGGIGYQFDLTKGDVKLEDKDLDAENELKAFTVRAGIGVKF